jgi:hypothetical protein
LQLDEPALITRIGSRITPHPESLLIQAAATRCGFPPLIRSRIVVRSPVAGAYSLPKLFA